MSGEARIQPTPDQDRCAAALVGLLAVGVPYADALAMIRLVSSDGNTDRTRTVGAMVAFGIPFTEAIAYADDPGMRVALLAHIQRARGGHPL